ncbi:hypothetical protein ARMSODRAFT_997861 [Armillaria solidipes]|uniref:Uncharacterized protein n=1 Tax=Armillaria solidipes TaxID=1076256 RepID=A0A2H3ANS6_9AGAR|nr:hypothetical protein ARMSODRAFT_997861 [Armillaria solidipes]
MRAAWTSLWTEAFYKKLLILADRDMVEARSNGILANADWTMTHTDITVTSLLRAHALGVVTHNASIMNAGACDLQLYNVCQPISLGFFTDAWNPDSFYERIKENADLDLLTFVLLDIKVNEQSKANKAQRPRYMSIRLTVSQLIETESLRHTSTLLPDTTLAIALSCVGGGRDNKNIVSGILTDLVDHAEDAFEDPLDSLVIVGKRLHRLEVEYAQDWRKTVKQVYGCALD